MAKKKDTGNDLSFDDYKSYEDDPISNPGEGPGWIEGFEDKVDDFPQLKLEELEDETVLICGFLRFTSQFEDQDYFVVIHGMMEDKTHFKLVTGSKPIMDVLMARWQRDQIPMKARVVTRKAKSTGRTYFTLI